MLEGPDQARWKSVVDVELATLGWGTGFNTVTLHGTFTGASLSEYEAAYHHKRWYAQGRPATRLGSNEQSVHRTQGDQSRLQGRAARTWSRSRGRSRKLSCHVRSGVRSDSVWCASRLRCRYSSAQGRAPLSKPTALRYSSAVVPATIHRRSIDRRTSSLASQTDLSVGNRTPICSRRLEFVE